MAVEVVCERDDPDVLDERDEELAELVAFGREGEAFTWEVPTRLDALAASIERHTARLERGGQ